AAGRIDPQKLRIFWTSPGYCHCNFTARADLPPELAARFTQVILAMDYQKPEQKRIMDLEGLTRWVPGRTEGYRELEAAARELNMLSQGSSKTTSGGNTNDTRRTTHPALL